ncbi:MAG: pyruvate kinase [Desulfofustis sp. PB-SRB1]|jgi:pyruvate kinase|nr:pyruvate kinase [Desulfofustis sp. PB-SRB1]MBM1001591.1 pyruvate kinase [Desulfofustis sp. PB-SRB1]HBH29811.1 pyruvate kinase [Desulfofustis sp.]
MPRLTKIVATISSRKCSVGFIENLFKAGMNVARLNTAHMTHADAKTVIDNIRAVSDKIGILLDTKGPEIRTGEATEPLSVRYGDGVRIISRPGAISSGDTICVSYHAFVRDVPVGSSILIDDGHIALAVLEKDENYLYCSAENDGVIHQRKSINIPAVHVKLPALSEKDKDFIRFAADHDLDFIAHSFVRNKEDVRVVQEILDEKHSPIKIIAKIENAEGVQNLSEILDAVYGIMIARGDLAVEIPTEQIPLIQKRIVRECIERRKPVIVATQMLHSMIESPRPTRAEVSDVANACLDYTDALMLSGETASGNYPDLAVRTMAKIAVEVESKRQGFVDASYDGKYKVAAYLAKAAVKAALRLNTKAIVADSLTGMAIRALSAYRGPNVIYAQVYDPRVMRLLSLSYGAYAEHIPMDLGTGSPLQNSVCRLIDENKFNDDDLIVILAGSFGPRQGVSYIEISTAANFRQKCHGFPALHT